MILISGKGIFIFALAGIFLRYFCYKSYVKYNKYDTVFTETRVKVDPPKLVGITIFAWHKTMFNGWKNNERVFDLRRWQRLCNESTDFDRVVQCINNRTYKHNDIIEKYQNMIFPNQTDVIKETIYTDDITTFAFGKSYTIKISYSNEDGYHFIIHLKPGQNYSIFIHDPNFYVVTINPEVFPHILSTWMTSKANLFS